MKTYEKGNTSFKPFCGKLAIFSRRLRLDSLFEPARQCFQTQIFKSFFLNLKFINHSRSILQIESRRLPCREIPQISACKTLKVASS